MRTILPWFLSLLMFALSFAKDTNAQSRGMAIIPAAQRHALLIGINGYEAPVAPLRFCVKDMRDLAAELEKVGFPKDNIHLMIDSSNADWKPTAANILAQVKTITGAMKEGDFLFVAFSGHGVMMNETSYLCPLDVNPDEKSSFVNRDQIFQLMDACPASRKIFLCDACRNEFTIKGAGGRSLIGAKTLTDPLGTDQHGFILMSSCAQKQTSVELTKFGNGVFMHFLLEGLRGAAANDKGFVSVMRLFAHANEQTINFTRGSQTPMFRQDEEFSDFIIAKVDRPAIKPSAPAIRIEDISGKITWGEIEIPTAEAIMVEDLTLPAVPTEITKTRIEIQLIQEAIRQLEAGSHPVLEQSQQAVREAKAIFDQAAANYREINAPREESWRLLPSATQEKLMAAILENPQLKVSSVRTLCPEDLSYVDFAMMINEGKRVQPVLKEYQRVEAEYKRVQEQAKTILENALRDLRAQMKQKEEAVPPMVRVFQKRVFLSLMARCTGYEDINAEFPFDEMITMIPAMEKFEFGWEEKALFEEAEEIWGVDRPCIVNRRGGERMTKTVNGVEFAFRWCPVGTFTMGSPESEEGREYNETQHSVTLTKGFWMQETEVTQAQWKAVMGTTIQEQAEKMLLDDTEYEFSSGKKTLRDYYGFKGEENPDEIVHGIGNDYPMYYVNWNESIEFCRKLSSKLDIKVQLPTEAQWEYACRAGTQSALYNGDLEIIGERNGPKLDPIAWYGGNSSVGFSQKSRWDSSNWSETQYPGGPCGAHPVGKKAPNAWGLYDMTGNVWEWCNDWYEENTGRNSVTDPKGPEGGSKRVYRGLLPIISAPTGPEGGSKRVYRGGGWSSLAPFCRSAGRLDNSPEYRYFNLGFRLSLGQ